MLSKCINSGRLSRRARRSSNGSLYALAIIAAAPLMLAIGAFAVDIMHYNAVQAEVQRACDAGALAGAHELWRWTKNHQAPIEAAETVCGMNDADGRPISSVSGASVNAEIPAGQEPSVTNGGQVRCSVKMPYKNLLATFFGAFSNSLSCTALAGPVGNVNVASYGGLFPLAIAEKVIALKDGKSLKDHNAAGELIYVELHNNVAWTGFDTHNAHDVNEFIDNYMHPGSGHGSPPVKIGQQIDLTNGIQDNNVQALAPFAGNSGAPQSGDIIYFPVIDENSGPHGPITHVQNAQQNLDAGMYTVIGFIGIRVVEIHNQGHNSYFTGILTNGIQRGSWDGGAGGLPTGGVWNNIKYHQAKLLI
jgi:hypothetical protein